MVCDYRILRIDHLHHAKSLISLGVKYRDFKNSRLYCRTKARAMSMRVFDSPAARPSGMSNWPSKGDGGKKGPARPFTRGTASRCGKGTGSGTRSRTTSRSARPSAERPTTTGPGVWTGVSSILRARGLRSASSGGRLMPVLPISACGCRTSPSTKVMSHIVGKARPAGDLPHPGTPMSTWHRLTATP